MSHLFPISAQKASPLWVSAAWTLHLIATAASLLHGSDVFQVPGIGVRLWGGHCSVDHRGRLAPLTLGFHRREGSPDGSQGLSRLLASGERGGRAVASDLTISVTIGDSFPEHRVQPDALWDLPLFIPTPVVGL